MVFTAVGNAMCSPLSREEEDSVFPGRVDRQIARCTDQRLAILGACRRWACLFRGESKKVDARYHATVFLLSDPSGSNDCRTYSVLLVFCLAVECNCGSKRVEMPQ